LLFVVLAGSSLAGAQAQPAASHTMLIVPFENASSAPGLEWVGETFPEILGQRMASPQLYLVGRQDRSYAFDRLGIPQNLRPSRATLYRVGEEMDVDYIVMGRYSFDGRTFTVSARLLEMSKLHLLPEVTESGPLPKLLDLESALAWDLLRQLTPDMMTSRNQFVAAAPSVRLDAFENYIRGLLATVRQEKIRYFHAALRVSPSYGAALLELGKTYYAGRDYKEAAAWLARVSKTDPLVREANFYLGLALFYAGDFDRAESAFSFVASRLPLIEVYNNLGVVSARRSRKNAVGYFQKAANADPTDPDYRFNLGVALSRAGDSAGATRELREALRLRPSDSEATTLLATLSGSPTPAPARASGESRLPLERIKSNYDETAFRQLALEIQNQNELRFAGSDPVRHADFHTLRGGELMEQGLLLEAEHEFREAIVLDPTNAAAHAGLAHYLEATREYAAARTEARTALRLHPSVEAFLVLARLDLRDNNTQAAQESVNRALALDPANAEAQELRRAVAAKLAEKAQPLPPQ
jgi:tetratricopeptide (TPR) repeat protein